MYGLHTGLASIAAYSDVVDRIADAIILRSVHIALIYSMASSQLLLSLRLFLFINLLSLCPDISVPLAVCLYLSYTACPSLCDRFVVQLPSSLVTAFRRLHLDQYDGQRLINLLCLSSQNWLADSLFTEDTNFMSPQRGVVFGRVGLFGR